MGSAHAFAVAEGGAIVAERDAGVVVPWWSFTKSVIAAAALTLVRDSKLDLDAPMGAKPFTLRQLLQHRAGVGEYGALTEYHRAVAASSAEVVAKIAQAARALGWPDHVVSAVVHQLQSTAEMQIKLIDHTLEIWREQITSWPSLTSEGHWPDADAFKEMSVNHVQFWTRMGEQWQKNWAQTIMSQWARLAKRNVPPKGDDRE